MQLEPTKQFSNDSSRDRDNDYIDGRMSDANMLDRSNSMAEGRNQGDDERSDTSSSIVN